MNNKIFIFIVCIITLIGVVTTLMLVNYTIEIRKTLSITSYIANEEDY